MKGQLMQLSQLLASLNNEVFNIDVKNLVLDSRRIQAGDIFIAIKGSQSDGRDYIPAAISKGAAAILVDCDEVQPSVWQDNCPLIFIPNLASQLGSMAARFYGEPAKSLRMIGVTGTNGKTSCSHFIAQSLEQPCAVIGTLGMGFYGQLKETGMTTPDAITLQASLKQFAEQGAKAVVMEVSSHSIHQGRVNAIPFEVGIFTNLTQDHLDYHGDMQTYANVKRHYLENWPIKHLVMNADDVYGKEWIQAWAAHPSLYVYGTKPFAHPKAVLAKDIQLSLQGITARVETPWGEGQLSLPLIGRFNLSNALATLTTLCLCGLDLPSALQRLSVLNPVPGRMQTIGGVDQPLVVVDYSHTPDALENALSALRAHTKGQLYCVFGCGGDRDKGKRPLMAAMAEKLADKVIVTTDNPRHENPADIIEQICEGFKDKSRITIEPERAKAIAASIQWAGKQDCILIAGKGAEHYQQIGDVKHPFDDVEQAKLNLVKH